MFIKLNTCLETTNNNYIHTYLYFKNIQLIKPLKSLHVKKLFTIYMLGTP